MNPSMSSLDFPTTQVVAPESLESLRYIADRLREEVEDMCGSRHLRLKDLHLQLLGVIRASESRPARPARAVRRRR